MDALAPVLPLTDLLGNSRLTGYVRVKREITGDHSIRIRLTLTAPREYR